MKKAPCGTQFLPHLQKWGTPCSRLVEVKYREQAPIPNDDAIIELSREASASIIVTKRADDYGAHHTPDGRELIRIPAFAFLYLLGNAEKNR